MKKQFKKYVTCEIRLVWVDHDTRKDYREVVTGVWDKKEDAPMNARLTNNPNAKIGYTHFLPGISKG